MMKLPQAYVRLAPCDIAMFRELAGDIRQYPVFPFELKEELEESLEENTEIRRQEWKRRNLIACDLERIADAADRDAVVYEPFNAEELETPRCPKCEGPMGLVKPTEEDRWPEFWGCNSFPICKGTRTILFVYALVDPDSNKPFYVGLTKNLKNRIREHIHSSRQAIKQPEFASEKAKKIDALISQGKEPIIKILQVCCIDRGNRVIGRKAESYWIRKLIQEGNALTNRIG